MSYKHQEKVFCVGFHKTGTTSLDIALQKLGYKVCGSRTDLVGNLKKCEYDKVWEIADKYDVLEDNPWPIIYKELDERYPNSKFILTTRDEKSWLKSIVNHFGTRHSEMREWIYGVGFPKGNEEVYIKRYRKHNLEVTDYFKGQRDKLLILELGKGDEWERLCHFLNHPVPDVPFPVKNRGNYSLLKKLAKRIKSKIKLTLLNR